MKDLTPNVRERVPDRVYKSALYTARVPSKPKTIVATMASAAPIMRGQSFRRSHWPFPYESPRWPVTRQLCKVGPKVSQWPRQSKRVRERYTNESRPPSIGMQSGAKVPTNQREVY